MLNFTTITTEIYTGMKEMEGWVVRKLGSLKLKKKERKEGCGKIRHFSLSFFSILNLFTFERSCLCYPSQSTQEDIRHPVKRIVHRYKMSTKRIYPINILCLFSHLFFFMPLFTTYIVHNSYNKLLILFHMHIN